MEKRPQTSFVIFHNLTEEHIKWLQKNNHISIPLTIEMKYCGIKQLYDLCNNKDYSLFYGDYILVFDNNQYIDLGMSYAGIQQLCEISFRNQKNLIVQ